MPDSLGKASEFGGKVQKNRVQPPPHVPTPSERLMLLYTTGDESGLTDPDPNGDVMMGLLPEDVQRQIRQDEGALDKGQVWDEVKAVAEVEIAAIQAEQGPIAP